jgi:hypothetical protein
MKGEKGRIERLLDKNAAEQLARVDWDRLTDQISARLNRATRIDSPARRYPAFFKIAAGIAGAAAVIFLAVVFRMHEPSDVQVPKGRSAVIEFMDRQGTASIQISDPPGKSFVVVHTGHGDRKAAKCEVRIIDRGGDVERESSRAAWIIISRPQRTLADDGHSKEETDVMCLL